MSRPLRSMLSAGYVPLDVIVFRGEVSHAAGGTAGNVAAILSFLGWDSAVAADIGVDPAGRRLVADLQGAGVDVAELRIRPGAATPRVVHEINDGCHRFRFRCPRCGQRLPRSRRLSRSRALEVAESRKAPDVFFFDRINHGTLELAERFAGAGAFIAFEPSTPVSPSLLERALTVVDLVKYADDRRVGEVANRSGGPKKQIKITTHGAAGASYRVGEGAWHRSPAFPYPTVDPGGAGDWTTAGLLHALDLTTRPSATNVGDALRWGQALAAVSCGWPGARGLARHQTTQAVLRSVRFLQSERQSHDTADHVGHSTLRQPVARNACAWCLLPAVAAPTARSRSAQAQHS